MTNTLRAACLNILLLAIVLPASSQTRQVPQGAPRMQPPIQRNGPPTPEGPRGPKMVPLKTNAGSGVPTNSAPVGGSGPEKTASSVNDNRRVQDPLPTDVKLTPIPADSSAAVNQRVLDPLPRDVKLTPVPPEGSTPTPRADKAESPK